MAVVKPLTMPFPNDIDLSNKATADPKKVYDVPQKPRLVKVERVDSQTHIFILFDLQGRV